MTKAGRKQLAFPLTLSLLLHLGAAGAVLYVHTSVKPQSQPFRATLTATIAGPRALGVVSKVPPPIEPQPAPEKSPSPRTELPKTRDVPITKAETKSNKAMQATSTPDPVKSAKASAADPPDTKSTKAAPPPAGGGTVGGRGADVTDAVFKGIDFPDQAYLNHIINRIMVNFRPPANTAYVAEFSFEILRDGTLQNLKMIRRSRNSSFDAEAEGAIERAGRARGFGRLPAVWNDDILRIEFSFDPKVIGNR